MPSKSRQIVFLSDFGFGNEWVGICHSVLTDIAPQSPIVDLSHLVRPLQVVAGALLLADCVPYTSTDAVALAIVDPNVGKDREIAIETASGRTLVGPDNGLLLPAAEAAGGARMAVEITSPDVIREPIARFVRATRSAPPPRTSRPAWRSTGWALRSIRRRSRISTSRSPRRRSGRSTAR